MMFDRFAPCRVGVLCVILLALPNELDAQGMSVRLLGSTLMAQTARASPQTPPRGPSIKHPYPPQPTQQSELSRARETARAKVDGADEKNSEALERTKQLERPFLEIVRIRRRSHVQKQMSAGND
jgi:hypothetical protein